MTAEDYAAIVEQIGVEGDMDIPRHDGETESRKVCRAALLENIAALVVE